MAAEGMKEGREGGRKKQNGVRVLREDYREEKHGKEGGEAG